MPGRKCASGPDRPILDNAQSANALRRCIGPGLRDACNRGLLEQAPQRAQVVRAQEGMGRQGEESARQSLRAGSRAFPILPAGSKPSSSDSARG